MSRGLDLNIEHFPILYLKIGSKYDEADLRAFEAEMKPIFERRQKYVMIVETSSTSYLPDARMRKAVVEWWKEMAEVQKRWNLGTAIMVSSAPIRGALTALSWLFTSPTPQTFVSNLEEALAWSEKLLREAEITPPDLSALRRRTAG